MLPPMVLVISLLTAMTPIPGAIAAGPDASPSGSATLEAATSAPIRLWLSGPFGRVEGRAVFEPAAAAPAGTALDTYVKRAPLALDAGEAALPTRSIGVTAMSVATGEVETLSAGPLAFEGPASAGRFIVVASVQTPDGRSTRRAWLVEVPDREPPSDGLYDIPAPDIVVESRADSAAGVPGNGCYLYLCVEVGRMPPAAALPTLVADTGEVLAARVSDGSAIIAWDGSLRRSGDPGGPRLASSGVITDELAAVVELTGLEAPTAGVWILTLRVVFDRDRGWLESRYRVRAE